MPHRNLDRLLAAALAIASIALPAAAKKEFRETTSVVVVEIPVNVIRDGDPVRGLSAENFELRDGRKKVDLIGFEEVDLSLVPTGQGTSPRVPIAARRHFLLLFDLSFSAPSALLRARRAAQETVLDDLHETDLVAVATYASNVGARLILSFTPDRRQVDLALETLGAPNLLDLQPDPLGILLGQTSGIAGFRDELSNVEGGGGGRTGGFEAALEEHLQSIYQASATNQRRQQASRVSDLTRSLSDLAGLMSAVEGRKHVVYLSQGFDSSLLLGTASQTRINQTNAASASGEIWNISGNERFGDTSAINDLEQMIEAFRRADCAVQSVDIGTLATGSDLQARSGSGKDGLVAMAKGSGGEFYENFNDLGEAMGELLERTSVTYLLAFQPKNLEHDGSFHKIKVKLVNAPSGSKLQHKPGYYAPKPLDEQTATERNLVTSQKILGGEVGGKIEVAAIATPFRVKGEKAYVPVFIEVDGTTLMDTSKAGTLGIELYAYAVARDGGIGDYFSRQVGLDLAQAKGTLSQGGVKFYGHLDLSPGDYSIRILVRNAGTGADSIQNLELSVPHWGTDSPFLTSPVFPEPMGRWLMIREDEEQQKERTAPYPYMGAEGPFFPAARPSIAAGERAPVWLAAYNLDGADVELSGRILDEAGNQVGSDLTGLERRVDPAGGVDVISTILPADLQAGKYQIEITAGSGAGSAPSAATASFEVR